MKLTIQKNKESALIRLRRLGYTSYTNKQGKESYIRRIQGGSFPRFHLYIDIETIEALNCTLHLDQTAPIYKAGHAHRGDYDSIPVKDEVIRLEK